MRRGQSSTKGFSSYTSAEHHTSPQNDSFGRAVCPGRITAKWLSTGAPVQCTLPQDRPQACEGGCGLRARWAEPCHRPGVRCRSRSGEGRDSGMAAHQPFQDSEMSPVQVDNTRLSTGKCFRFLAWSLSQVNLKKGNAWKKRVEEKGKERKAKHGNTV